MGKDLLSIETVILMKGNLGMVRNEAMDVRLIMMDRSLKASTSTTYLMEKEFQNLQMGTNTLAIGSMGSSMDLEVRKIHYLHAFRNLNDLICSREEFKGRD